MEAVPKDKTRTVYCIDAEDDFCTGLEQNALRVIRGSLGYRYDQALVRNLPHPPHECDVIVYNLCKPACYDARSWGPGRNDNYHCEVVKLERDGNTLFHYKDKERVFSQYKIVSETQISRAGINVSSSFDVTDILRAVTQGGVPLVYFLNPTFLENVSSYLPLWLQMTVDVSPTLANEFDLADFAEGFSESLSKIGRGNLDLQRPIRFRINKAQLVDKASQIIVIKVVLNRVGDTLAALISYGKGYIFFLPPFQNDINGCVDLVKDVIPHFQEDLRKSAERNRAKLTSIAELPHTVDPNTPDMIPLQTVSDTRDYIKKVVHEVNVCYRYECYNASAAMIRRLVETLIIEIYETNGRALEIQDKEGNFLKLEGLLGKISSGSFVNISQNSKQFLKNAKILGDTVVHNRKVILRREDLDFEKVSLRMAIYELVKYAQF